MPAFTEGVEYEVVAQEWRCKWSADNDKASLAAVNTAAAKYFDAIKAMPGFKSIQRIICGECQDFKVIFAFEHDKFGDVPGEAEFLAEAAAIPGILRCETQTYTLAQM